VKKAAVRSAPAPRRKAAAAVPKPARQVPAKSASPSPAKPLGRRSADQGDTRQAILQAAMREFARGGYDGARIDRISKAARANDRMIYYYFGSKEQLFIEALEAIYAELGAAESALELDLSRPVAALEAVVRFTLDYYRGHPEMIALLNNENLRSGADVAKSRKVRSLSSPLTSLLERILESGAAQGLFRRDMRSQDLYIAIAALHYFYVSNRYTLSRFLGTDLMGAAALAHWSDFAVDMVLRTVRAGPALPKAAPPKPASPKAALRRRVPAVAAPAKSSPAPARRRSK
jgi:AcrR family transcriptional regulator